MLSRFEKAHQKAKDYASGKIPIPQKRRANVSPYRNPEELKKEQEKKIEQNVQNSLL